MTRTAMETLRHAHTWTFESDWSFEVRIESGKIIFNAACEVFEEGLRSLGYNQAANDVKPYYIAFSLI